MRDDDRGHQEGDRLISVSAEILKTQLKSAASIYRMGGDEFLAIYGTNVSNNTVKAEMDAVSAACRNANNFALPLRLAMGYQRGPLDEHMHELIQLADQQMYSNKAQLKEDSPLPLVK